jgi:hypothetical protein
MFGGAWDQAEQLDMEGEECWMTTGMHRRRLGLTGSPGKQKDKEDREGQEGLGHNSCCALVYTTALIWQGRRCRESWHKSEHEQGGNSSR